MAGVSMSHRLMSELAEDLEKTCGPHPAANAHGDHTVFGFPAASLQKERSGTPGAGHTEGVSNGDGSTIHIVLLRVDTEPVTAVQALGSERLLWCLQDFHLHPEQRLEAL